MLLTDGQRADIQGFVTSGYGHLKVSRFLCLAVQEQLAGQKWLAGVIPQVTTARSWRVDPDESKVRPRVAINVAFTAAGLRAIGLSQEVLCTFSDEFREGMKTSYRSRILGDVGSSAPENWEFGGTKTADIHVLLMLYAESPGELDQLLVKHRDWIAEHKGVDEVAAQEGSRLGVDREPFGFRDGMGQPQIEGIKGSGENHLKTGEFILGHENEYGLFTVSPVVSESFPHAERLPPYENPHHVAEGLRDLGGNGTYMVYRKLEQDVQGFWNFVAENAVDEDSGEPDREEMLRLAAKMVGRWPSGASLAVTPEHDDPKLGHDRERNDAFYYMERDRYGFGCPVGSHIRRTNPRDSILPENRDESVKTSNRHRILRRAMTFGGRLLFDLEELNAGKAPMEFDDDAEPRGIHFFCINADIQRQFEFVQQTWSNNPRFNGLYNNRDPLIGNHDVGEPSHMIVPARPLHYRTSPMPRFVSVRGGGYFFMPSLSALRFLAGDALTGD